MASATNRTKIVFGISSLALYERTAAGLKGKKIAFFNEGIQKASFEDKVNIVKADPGGAYRYSVDAQVGKGEAKLSLEFNKQPLGLFEALKGRAVTEASAEASGSITSTLTNVVGTSVATSITGAAITSGAGASLPLGRVTIIAVSTTTVDVWIEGQDTAYLEAVTISTGSNVLSGLGITLTGHSTVSMTAGDQAHLTCSPNSSELTTLSLTGNENPVLLWGVLTAQETIGSSQLVQCEFPKILCASMPMNLMTAQHAKFTLDFEILKPTGGNYATFKYLTRA